MRPRYETAAGRTHEERVIARAAAAWSCQVERMPKMYALDWALLRGKLAAWVEIKCRAVPHDRYPTLLLSAHKWEFGLRYAALFRVPFILLVEFTDGLYYWRAEDIAPRVEFGGRTDRGDWQDIEPVVHLPLSLFKPVRE